jgi:CRISPR system Cascade subunit CasC
VAHAISTNKVSMEFDFFTAVDDLSPKEETGAGMMGTVEFNSACFYRYANIDLKQLAKNLGNDTELAEKAVEAFLRASVAAIPTGKQNSMAAQNPPSLVFAVVREQGLWSLANAFVNPVRPGNDGLVQKSITALEDYWGKLAAAYGEEEIKTKAILAVEGELGKLKEDQAGNLTELMAKVRAGIKREPGGEG